MMNLTPEQSAYWRRNDFIEAELAKYMPIEVSLIIQDYAVGPSPFLYNEHGKCFALQQEAPAAKFKSVYDVPRSVFGMQRSHLFREGINVPELYLQGCKTEPPHLFAESQRSSV